MPELLVREKLFNAVCFLAGGTARTLGFKLTHPIFIIGTGRCGTSLLVDILRSHPKLSGFPGEANELWHPMLFPFESTRINIPPIEINPKQFSEVSVASWPSRHREKIRDIFTGFKVLSGSSKTFFTKSAMISFLIPEILQIFPDTKFIHIYRFGPSVVESYIKKNFGKYSQYVFSDKDYRIYCASYWNACILEIEKMKKVFSLEANGQFLEFSYEHLCNNSKEVLFDLANYLGVGLDGFKFDLSSISSQNYKAGNYEKYPYYEELINVMSSGMNLKGYLLSRPDSEMIRIASG